MRIGDWSSDVCSSDLSVEKDDSGEAMVAAAIAAFGRLDIVVANAASPQAASFHKLSLADFRAVFDVGFFGTLHLVHAAWPRLRDQDRTSVVSGKSVSVRVDLGGRRIIKNKKQLYEN